MSFDVSTSTPTLLQEGAPGADGGNGESLTLSHDGRYIVSSNGDITSLVPTDDLSGIAGTFPTGLLPGPSVFSADDTLLYQAEQFGDGPDSALKVFSTSTFTQVASIDLPFPEAQSGEPEAITSIAVTAPNGYLYVAGNTSVIDSTPTNLRLISTQAAPFFNGSVALSDGFYYLLFPDGNLFGYYNLNTSPYLFHSDLGFEYPIDAADGSGGIYLYDFTSQTFFYTSATLFPYLYDFTLNSFLYYYPNTRIAGHYTAYPRYFYDFASSQIITK